MAARSRRGIMMKRIILECGAGLFDTIQRFYQFRFDVA